MSNKTLIIVAILIIAGLGLFVGGYLGGTLYQKEKDKFQKATDLFEYLGSSKIISSFVATGEVTKISGRTVTLSSGIEKFSDSINENVQVYSFAPGLQAVSSFEAIKIGDNLDVNERVLSDGQLEVLGIIIR